MALMREQSLSVMYKKKQKCQLGHRYDKLLLHFCGYDIIFDFIPPLLHFPWFNSSDLLKFFGHIFELTEPDQMKLLVQEFDF